MSIFNIESNTSKGIMKHKIQCEHCNHTIIFTMLRKHFENKITVVTCSKCNYINQIGNIFNFDSGPYGNKQIADYLTQEVVDNYIWDMNYDKI